MRRKLAPLIAGLVLLLGAHASLALTLSDLRTEIRRNVRDTASSTSLRRYSDTVLNARINEAQRAVINDTWASSDSSTAAVTVGTTYYSVSTGTIAVWRVTLDNAMLVDMDLNQLDADNNETAWLASTGTPTAFFRDRSNRDQIGLYPAPIASGTIKIFSYQIVPDLSADADVPYDADYRLYAYHDLLIYHATYRLLVAENRIPEAEQYKEIYNGGVELMNANVGHKPVRPLAQSKEQKP